MSAALAADASLGRSGATATAEVDADSTASSWGSGMQFLSAVVGCAAVGTVLWSEFVLKETGEQGIN